MKETTSIEKIRKYIKESVGKTFDIAAKRGRKRIMLENCIIDSAYPSIFVVKTKDAKTDGYNSFSFSYIDILTKNVALRLREIENEKGA